MTGDITVEESTEGVTAKLVLAKDAVACSDDERTLTEGQFTREVDEISLTVEPIFIGTGEDTLIKEVVIIDD